MSNHVDKPPPRRSICSARGHSRENKVASESLWTSQLNASSAFRFLEARVVVFGEDGMLVGAGRSPMRAANEAPALITDWSADAIEKDFLGGAGCAWESRCAASSFRFLQLCMSRLLPLCMSAAADLSS